MQEVKIEVLDYLYKPFRGGDMLFGGESAHKNEVTWARNHALNWAEQAGLPEEEADGFAEYFKNGWIEHLDNNASKWDREMRRLYNQFRKDSDGDKER